MKTETTVAQRIAAAIPRGVSVPIPILAHHASGAEIWDAEGRRYIDFGGGIAVLNVGHRHPHVIAAVHAQLDAFTHTCFGVTPYESYIKLAERMNQLAPISETTKKKTIFLTTGAEAVENAVKIARHATGRSAIISFTGGFHGRTLMALALTGKINPYKAGFGPFPADTFHAPFPDAYRGGSTKKSLAALEMLFKSSVEPSRVAAIIIEPVQGEGGFNVAPFEFLRELRALCDRHGIVFIADEIQTGFGRTGRMFAVEHAGVEPDLITIAKSLAGGFPLSGVIGRAAIMDSVAPGGLGGTFAGSPVSCAAALAVLDVFRDEHVLERAEKQGVLVRARLEVMRERFPIIGDVRGLGAMLAIELVRDRATREPAPELASRLAKHASERGLILLTAGIYGNVIRILAPLTASPELMDEGMTILEHSLADLG
ncbi:MAG: 4-aminobutyrate--2-oxoglutarate transaminase [Candidatus Binatus sp.]|uniref:4-aminobutyrate--2-oxoglutarate transaminase n=1 Tax=Candidatus Binatus sp. TaxID=2811406 RepID=UPI003BAEE607